MTTQLIVSLESGTTEGWDNTQVDSTTKYTGGYALGIGPNGSTKVLPAALDEFYIGWYGTFTEGVTPWTTIIYALRNGADECVSIRFDALGRPFLAVRGSTQPGFGEVLSRSTWYYFELYVLVAEEGAATLRVDGDIKIEIEDIDTRPAGTATNVDRIYFNYNNTGYKLIIDDLTVNGLTGSLQNSWPNGIRYLRMDADADGSYSQWDPLGGGNHFSKVNEIPPSAAQYNSTSTATERDSYALESAGSAGIPVGATITTVQQIVYLSEDVVSADTVDTFLRLAGADDDDGIGHSLPLTMGRREGLIRHEKPGGGAWGSSDLDALEIGVLS